MIAWLLLSIYKLGWDTTYLSRLQKIDLVFSYFLILIFHFFLIYFYFSILRTLGLVLEVIGHTVTSVTSDGVITILITRLKRRK